MQSPLRNSSFLPYLQHRATHATCYGNCISSSVSYVRSNPDGSLYLGDEFAVTPSVSLGPNTTSYSYSWSYDGAVLAAQGGWLLQVVANVSGTYSVTITATFTMVETVRQLDGHSLLLALDQRVGRNPRVRIDLPDGAEQRH